MGYLEDQIAAAKAKEKAAKDKAAAKRRADIAKARDKAKKIETDLAVRIASALREQDAPLYARLRSQAEYEVVSGSRDTSVLPVTAPEADHEPAGVHTPEPSAGFDQGGDQDATHH